MTKIIIFAVIGCVLSVILKQHCRELLLPFQLAFSVIALVYILNTTVSSLNIFTSVIGSLGKGYDVIKVLFKASLITIGVKLGGDVCRESGNYLMEDIIELGGRLMIFAVSVPYILEIIKISISFLE